MPEKKHLKLNDVEAYKVAFNLSNYLWPMIQKWPNSDRDTVGKQYMRAADSISANLAEGFGRFSKKDKINFYRYARGSVYECFDWNEKCKVRNIIAAEEYTFIFSHITAIA
jgi:four helix bundle protein